MDYGRNFSFRVPPVASQRSGRFTAPADVALPIGVPVIVSSTTSDSSLHSPVALASANAHPVRGQSGIIVFEHIQYIGDDPYLTTYADKDTVPAGAACQVVSGDKVKVCFRNTFARTFLNTRSYAGRIMVAGVGATPTVVVGDLLTPGTGNGTAGYWKETSTASEAWLVVTRVDNARNECEAEFLF